METKNKFKFCRYYNGEDSCPADLVSSGLSDLWNYERVWVSEIESGDDRSLLSIVRVLKDRGLDDFSRRDGVPLSLRALLLSRFYHQNGFIPDDCSDFKEWYLDVYLAAR